MSEKNSIRGFDFHCHVDLHPDPVALIELCAREGIFVLAVTTTPKAWPQNRIWASRSSFICAAVGLHPELVAERYQEMDLLEQQISESPFVGEVGLDGSRKHKKSYSQQRDVFIRVLDAAQKLKGRVLSIHSRQASRDVVTLIEERTTSDCVLSILHWFSGSISEVQRAVALGCYFSISHTMLSHNRGREIAKSLPLNRLLTETDSPFTSVGERRSLPTDVIETSTLLAKTHDISVTQMNVILMENAQRVLSFIDLAKR